MKILLAYDNSDYAEVAMERAARLSQTLDAQLFVISVIPGTQLLGGGISGRLLRDDKQRIRQRMQRTLGQGLRVTGRQGGYAPSRYWNLDTLRAKSWKPPKHLART
ncbi:Universal stress protein family [Desulfosporosinus metallidurans]|uniref:Universal stress protein family n=1 Tax=Desulfosporosinus metallidurans TaxID=1888891 RepID=A0A1Q8QBC1_9FIRM|nr:Universal stress protein family [Desulfosporosinus metallidurans]